MSVALIMGRLLTGPDPNTKHYLVFVMDGSTRHLTCAVTDIIKAIDCKHAPKESHMKFLKQLFGLQPKRNKQERKQALESKLTDLKRPAVRLLTSDHRARSKFGGKPLVETGSFDWPQSEGLPMAFLAQIDLAEMAQVHKYDWLGDQGLVLFFYDMNEMAWGFDPKDRGKWSVIYQAAPDTNLDYPENLADDFKIKERFMIPKRLEMLPHMDDLSLDSSVSDRELALYHKLNESTEPLHQLGGFPSPVQGNDMALEAQLASNGVFVGNAKGFRSAKAKALEAGAKDWRLLFQFDSDEALDLMWGDCGRLYFWVEAAQAKLNRFENSWLILQCS